MDINIIRGLSTLLVLFVFAGITAWALNPKRKQEFNEEAANLPFADFEHLHPQQGDSDTYKTGDKAVKKHNTGA